MQVEDLLRDETGVHSDDRFICMNHWYDIELSHCCTPEAILGWVDHLSSKNWVTKEMIQEFISCAAYHHGIKIHPF